MKNTENWFFAFSPVILMVIYGYISGHYIKGIDWLQVGITAALGLIGNTTYKRLNGKDNEEEEDDEEEEGYFRDD